MSPWAARPLLVATIKESRDTMVTFFKNFLDPEIHLLTHFSSSPSWDDSECCLWSPRGRQVVRREDCTAEEVTTKTVMKVPLLVKQESRTVQGEEEMQEDREMLEDREMQERVRVSRKGKHESPPPSMSYSEASRRFQAYKWMLEQGRLRGLKVEQDHYVSVSCPNPSECHHTKEDSGGCTSVSASQTKLVSVLKTVKNLVKPA